VQTAQQNFKVQLAVTLLSVVLFAAKMIAYYFTHSLAILTDALESIVNMLAGFIGLYSLYVAAKPSDKDHPYGHGKAEFLSAAVEGALITAAGFFIIYQTVETFFSKAQPHSIDTGIWLVAATALLNFIAGFVCIRIGKKNNSLALVASGKHLQIDTYSTLAVIAGLLFIYYTKVYWFDKALALIISLFIMYNGYKIIRSSIAGIMDEADMELLKELIIFLNKHRKENWIDLHNLRVIKYGALLHIDCHLTVPWYLNVHEAHEAVDSLTTIIKEKYGSSVELFIHTDACLNFSCSICTKEECSKRKRPFTEKVEWTLDNVLSDKKHNSAIG
jgi:cation diffusion facilitator family transporter